MFCCLNMVILIGNDQKQRIYKNFNFVYLLSCFSSVFRGPAAHSSEGLRFRASFNSHLLLLFQVEDWQDIRRDLTFSTMNRAFNRKKGKQTRAAGCFSTSVAQTSSFVGLALYPSLWACYF